MKKILSLVLILSLFAIPQTFAAGSGSGGAPAADPGPPINPNPTSPTFPPTTTTTAPTTTTAAPTTTTIKTTTTTATPTTRRVTTTTATPSTTRKITTTTARPTTTTATPTTRATTTTKAAIEDPELVEGPTTEYPAFQEVFTPKPTCNDKTTRKERINCRLNKTPNEIQKELDYSSNPEGCRRGSDGWQETCRQRYNRVQPCWEHPPGETRMSCVKEKLQLKKTLKPITEECSDTRCNIDYKQKVYHLITYRFYELEEQAEKWKLQGKLTLNATVDFVDFISQAKLDFYNANNKQERKDVIRRVLNGWKNLKSSNNL